MNETTFNGPDMKGKQLNILMLEDNPADSRLIEELLKDVAGTQYRFEQTDRLFHGMERLITNSIDVVILDLGLPDSQGMETLLSLSAKFKKMPIVVMTGLDDEDIAIKAVHKGAQDYLVKGQVDGTILSRSLRYAVERKQVQQENELSLKILQILNRPGEQKGLIRMILMLIKEFSGCEAVGIRLKEGYDYPYLETSGFIPGHIEMEKHICAIDEKGKPILDPVGKPVLECMCGNIIRGRFDPDMSFFTEAGSFWTNCTTDLLASSIEAERLAFTRNRCNFEGYESVALVPLKTENGNIGLLQLCDTSRDKFSFDFIHFLEGIAESIGVVLARKSLEEKLLFSNAALKKTMNDAINIMVKVVEMRDLYTAGHQQRVADLSIAIAREMKLDEIFIEQLRMAAIVHDIGKINIPSELLSKPARLNDLEYHMIQTHPLGGFDIVKGMDFPCVIAQYILQHHERLDGSGYPKGLKGEDIILGARILAVADVVEAMASHRPYRPALGIDKALDEISKNKGKLYDSDVVDACLRLFNDKCFAFEQAVDLNVR